jgi:hypothetical protein
VSASILSQINFKISVKSVALCLRAALLPNGVGGLHERSDEHSDSIKGWGLLSNWTNVSVSGTAPFCRVQRHILLNTIMQVSFSHGTEYFVST